MSLLNGPATRPGGRGRASLRVERGWGKGQRRRPATPEAGGDHAHTRRLLMMLYAHNLWIPKLDAPESAVLIARKSERAAHWCDSMAAEAVVGLEWGRTSRTAAAAEPHKARLLLGAPRLDLG